MLVGLTGQHRVLSAPATPPSPYLRVSIAEPPNQTTLRDNGGNVTVRVELTPPLQIAQRHCLKLLIDGRSKPLRDGELSLVLKNIDRGTHEIVALVVNAQEVELARSASVTFYLHRRSLLHPNQKAKRPKKTD